VCFQGGWIEEARQAVERGLALDPHSADLLLYRGNLSLHEKSYRQAVEAYRQALAVQPESVEAYCNLGRALAALDDRQGALGSYDGALKIQPGLKGALRSKLDLLREMRRFGDALECCRRLLSLDEGDFDAHIVMGNVLYEAKRFAEAATCYERAIGLNPQCAEAHFNRGTALKELHRYDDALASLDRAIGLKESLAEAHNNRGNVLQRLRRFGEALAGYDRAVELAPDSAPAHNNRGNVLLELKRYEEAVKSFDRALALNGEFGEAHYNRGNALRQLGLNVEALASYERAAGIDANEADVWNNRGLVLHELRRLDEALASYERAIRLEPEHADAHWNRGLTLLLLGDFAAGWPEYEWRWRRAQVKGVAPERAGPLWLGDGELRGKTILLHAEQGLGDTIQFCRYVPRVAALGAQVVLEVQPALMPLLGDLPGVTLLAGRGDALPAYDCHCPLLSLPLAFGSGLADLAGAPYLRAAADRSAAWQSMLGERRAPRVGIVWSGSIGHQNDRNRSIPFADYQQIFQKGVSYFCLQKDVRPADRAVLAKRPEIGTFETELRDFADTAALIMQLDLVITVDTSVAHLAGALGKEAWILLPFMPDWRWLLDRADSPWYDSVRLFRQPGAGDWGSVLQEVGRMTVERFAGWR
jgi:tetratricopeptide (TPR) repeat protein